MSSFTSKNVRDLYEVYNSVYDQTELFLSNLLDTVTESVNELVNEGYDLSDYSWDEIYESFLENVLEPELQEVESFITQLNESSEELTEEQIENLLQERLGGLLSGLANLFKGRQAIQTATQTVTRAPKPSILQAPLVKPKTPAPAPTPSSNPLYAPGVSSGRPSRPSITPPPGADKGSFTRFGDWLSGFTKKGSAPAKPPAPTPPTGPSKPPGYQPTNLRGIDLRPALSAIRSTSGKLKAATYDKLPKNVRRVVKGATVATLASPLVGVAGRDVYRAATGGPSVTQTAAARAQQAYGVGEIGVGKLQGIIDPIGGQETVQSGQANVRAGSQSIADVKRKERERSMQGRTGRQSGTTGLPIYQHYEVDLDDKESINEVLVQGKDGKWYDAKFDASGKKISQVEVSPTQSAIDRYNKLKAQRSPAPTPSPAKPKIPGLPPSAAQPGQGPKGNEVGSRPATPPARPANDGGGTRRPPATPVAPVRQPAPQASPMAAYVKAAANARKSGDPAEMAKVRDMGMEIWRKSNPKLAAAADERARIRGTAQTDNPLMKDMRSRLPVTPTVQAPAVKDLGLGQQSLVQNPNAGRSPEPKTPEFSVSKDAKMNKVADNLSKNPLPKKEVKKEAYDIVLDYLLSEGHADTVSEANYIMLQMSADHIQDIVEISGELFRGILNPKNSAASKVQKTSPFNRPVTPLPSIVSPFAKPASRDDSGKLTPYGAGGGSAAEKGGQTRAEVMKQGAKNLENKKPINQGPDFGR